MSSINIALELYSILVSALIIMHLFVSGDKRDRLNNLFILMLLCNVAVLTCDLITWFRHYLPIPRPVLLVANFGVYSFGYVIVAVFTNYLVTYLGARTKISRRIVQVMTVLCGIAILLVLVSQFNHMYYYFDAADEYRRGDYYWFSQAFPIGMMIVDLALVVIHRRSLTGREVIALLSYQILPVMAMLIQIFTFGITLLYVGTSLSMLIIYVSIQVRHSLLLKEKELELQDSRVSIMLSQIQPHFLYNALGAIHQLCKVDPELAQEAVAEFAGYLRGNMDSLTLKRPVPFEKELEHVHNYLSLEQKRFGKRLNVVYDTPVLDFHIPSLTVQPIVENAVRYGVTQLERGGTVTIRTEDGGSAWRIIVADDGAGFDPNAPVREDGRSHVGIENVRGRLQRISGGTLSITSALGQGTTAVVTIPKKKA